MLPTIVETENRSFLKESHYANSKSPQKTDPDLPSHNLSPYKVSQHRSDRSTDLAKSNQAQKRGTSPYATVNFYPSIRSTVLPHPKLNISTRQSDSVRDTPHIPRKKSIDEVTDQAIKLGKPIPTVVYTHPDEIDSQSGRRSLPPSIIAHEKNIIAQNNSKIAREVLKAKFKGREYTGELVKPINSNYHQVSVSIPGKSHGSPVEANLSKASNDLLNDKSPNNAQLQNNYQRYLHPEKMKLNIENRSAVITTGDKTLLHSASKQNQKDYEHSYTATEGEEAALTRSHILNKDSQLRDVILTALKKSSNLTPINKGKDNTTAAYSPAIKLLLQKNESQPNSSITKSEKKASERSPSLNLKYKRSSQRDVISISPVKKGNSLLKDKPIVRQELNTTEIKKVAAPVLIILTDDEKVQYGNRFPADYEKLELLGKGGFALVWLGVCKKTGRKVALKQMSKSSAGGNDAKKNDLYYGQLLFLEGGEPREEFRKYPGINNIACFIDYKSTKMDDWHVSELCGKALSSQLFDIKGEFCKGERVYGVKYLDLHTQFRQNSSMFKHFIKGMAEAMDLFSNYYIVHCDIKPENILITMNPNSKEKPFQLKIIDFGSAYNWGDSGNVRMATPEYMPPEVLKALIGSSGPESSIEHLAEISKPWSVDIWSLGAVLLEIITGVPLWIPLKCKVEGPSRRPLRFGLFACKGRAYDKIFLKQKALVENFAQSLAEYLENWPEAENLFDLIVNMMKWDPKKRISPGAILQHPYMKSI